MDDVKDLSVTQKLTVVKILIGFVFFLFIIIYLNYSSMVFEENKVLTFAKIINVGEIQTLPIHRLCFDLTLRITLPNGGSDSFICKYCINENSIACRADWHNLANKYQVVLKNKLDSCSVVSVLYNPKDVTNNLTFPRILVTNNDFKLHNIDLIEDSFFSTKYKITNSEIQPLIELKLAIDSFNVEYEELCYKSAHQIEY